jgi:hypothetical protein
MAHYSIVHLNDEASEAFLYSRGFVLIASCSRISNWTCGHINLFFPVDIIIHSDNAIYSKISADYYQIGIKAGKRAALISITNSLSEVVFPREQSTQEY